MKSKSPEKTADKQKYQEEKFPIEVLENEGGPPLEIAIANERDRLEWLERLRKHIEEKKHS